MASNRWKEIGDPLRVFHRPEAEYGPYAGQWNSLLGQSTALSGQQMANVDPNLQQGWNMASQTAYDPNNTALLTNSRDYANQVLSGYYLNPETNLALAQQLQQGLQGMGAYDTQAAQAGRYGSGAWGQMKGQALGNMRANIYGQGLNQMTNMANNAASIYGSQYLPAQSLMDIGNQAEGRKWNILGQQANILGQTTGNNQPYYSQNPIMGGIGTAISAIGAIKGMGGGQQQQQNNGQGAGNTGNSNLGYNQNYGGYNWR